MEENGRMGSISIYHWMVLLLMIGLLLALIIFFVRKR